ncbi:MAG TPA: hypothetical protein VFC12_08925 [Terriglobales bacterium]|nr:hypothetical protein [Terriglobales bacterium]
MERSITQGEAAEAGSDLKERVPEEPAAGPTEADAYVGNDHVGSRDAGRSRLLWGIGLVVLVLAVYYFSQSNRTNLYMHFVLQAQSWMDGQTSIPTPGYQDVMPILDSNGNPTQRGIIPFPPLPAAVLLPFVAIWHLATNEQLLATIFGAIDVGIAYWMLGFLPVRQQIRRLTALFFGLGTVFWYTSVIGSTWFWAHVVAVGCLLMSVGLALSVDRTAAEPQPLREAVGAVRRFNWPGGWSSVAVLFALGSVGELLFVLAGAGTSAAALAGVGVLLSVLAALLAVVVAGRPGVLAPFVVAVAIVGGLPAVILAGAQSQTLIAFLDAGLVLLIAALWWFSRRRDGRLDRAMESLRLALSTPESVQVAAGILFGLAVTARLTILLGFPFLILVGGGGTWLRRAMLAGAGAAVPLFALLVITFATSGRLFNPAYDYLYHVELGYTYFNYNPEWSITDVRYIPQNIGIMLFGMPRILPQFSSVFPGNSGEALCLTTSARGLFDKSCPLAIPEATGTSIILSSPAYLVGLLAFRPLRNLKIDRVTAGATVAVLAIATINLMHFSQGWVQFGYRFSNDFVPFALILVALGASRLGRWWPLLAVLVGLSIVVNFWGVTWGVILGW